MLGERRAPMLRSACGRSPSSPLTSGTDKLELVRDHDHPTGSTCVKYVYGTQNEATSGIVSHNQTKV